MAAPLHKKKASADYLFKLIIIGDSSVGKSSFMFRYADDFFNENLNYPTIGVDYKIKKVVQDEKKITVYIWDTAGQEQYRAISKTYIKQAHGIIIMYSLDDPLSASNIIKWINQVKKVHDEDNMPPIVVVANKSDKDVKEGLTKVGKEWSDHLKTLFFVTSVKSNVNVTQTFDELIRRVKERFDNSYKRNQSHMEEASKGIIKLSGEAKKEGGCCSK